MRQKTFLIITLIVAIVWPTGCEQQRAARDDFAKKIRTDVEKWEEEMENLQKMKISLNNEMEIISNLNLANLEETDTLQTFIEKSLLALNNRQQVLNERWQSALQAADGLLKAYNEESITKTEALEQLGIFKRQFSDLRRQVESLKNDLQYLITYRKALELQSEEGTEQRV